MSVMVNRYAQRLSWLLCDGLQVCQVAILGDGSAMPWQAARQLYQSQIDFLYLDDGAVAEATVDGATLAVGTQAYRGRGGGRRSRRSAPAARRVLAAFADRRRPGHRVRGRQWTCPLASADLIDPDLRLEPAHPDLRYLHYRKGGLDFYLLCNEGGAAIEGEVSAAGPGPDRVLGSPGRCPARGEHTLHR